MKILSFSPSFRRFLAKIAYFFQKIAYFRGFSTKVRYFSRSRANFERKDGSVVFIKRDSDATLKELKFKEGYLVNFQEGFTSTSENPLNQTFTISAKEITMGNGTHTNEWV